MLSCSLPPSVGQLSENFCQFLRGFDHYIGRHCVERVRSKSIRHAARPQTRVAARQNVDGRIADHDRFLRRDTRLFENGLNSKWIGLLRSKAVAAIYTNKEVPQTERLNDVA